MPRLFCCYYLTQFLEELVISKFEPYYGNSVEQIVTAFKPQLSRNAKKSLANLTQVMLGVELGKKIEEFEKAEITVRTIRLKENNLPKENISFPAFKYDQLIKIVWENSALKKKFDHKFFFVFYQYKGSQLHLKKVKFWNMPYTDMQEMKQVWSLTIELIKQGKIVKEIKKGRRHTYFPNQKDHRICHVRPHAQNAEDTYSLPVRDKLTGLTEYTKHGFWLNASYVRDEIFLK